MIKDKRGSIPKYIIVGDKLKHQATGLTEVIHGSKSAESYNDEVRRAHTRLMNRLRKGEHKNDQVQKI